MMASQWKLAPLGGLIMQYDGFAVLVFLSALLFAGDCSMAEQPTMSFPGQDWEVVPPQAEGVDAEKLQQAIDNLEAGVGDDGVTRMVIVRNGRLIWQGDDIDHRQGVWSCTKSFTSTVLGLLIDDGKVQIDSRACESLPVLSESYPEVSLRHYTTMTSGYRAVGDQPQGNYTHGPSKTWFKPADQPLFEPPGSQYAYWDSAMNQFANMLTHAAGEPIEELFRRRIAEPIGMAPEGWDWGDFGEIDGMIVNGGSGNSGKHMRITARQLARFGHLFLNDGQWEGRQLISPEWVTAATSVQVPASTPWAHEASGIDGRGVYGFNWWVNAEKPDGKRKWPGAPVGTFAASGYNNNKCFVIPDWQMVVVRLGLDGNVKDEVWSRFFSDLSAAVGSKKAGS